ncbi:MAG: hypothetical protein P8O08_05255, partial [Paracoccaceae bacterium]|nr:hypothetical protein [Paracoccaceae bacterium]
NCSEQGPRAQPDTTALDALREQLSQANEKIAKTKQKLTVANEKEDGLYAKLVTSLLAQIEIGKKFRSEQTQLKNANEKISVLTRALEQ